MLSYIIPSRNRQHALDETLEDLSRLDHRSGRHAIAAEIVIIDNASSPPIVAPASLESGVPVRIIRIEHNHGAAARNLGAAVAQGEWLVMLDDDSSPIDLRFVAVLEEAPPDLVAIGAEILLPNGRRESGGLPEVFIGCGVAIRRQAFLDAGGYDPAYEYYAEEYDLAARFLLAGQRVTHDRRFRILHRKVQDGRDFNQIIRRLVRNNAWLMQRYAPAHLRDRWLDETIARYGSIAEQEHAQDGFARGLAELRQTLAEQPRRTMSQDLFDRFTGTSAVRRTLRQALSHRTGVALAVVAPGKNHCVVCDVLAELSCHAARTTSDAGILVIGTLSPGPMLDAAKIWRRRCPGHRIITPWHFGPTVAQKAVAAAL